MNKVIKKQLDNLYIAKSDGYDPVKHQFVFKKMSSVKLEENKFYLIKLHKSLISLEGCDVLVYNLNKGTCPTREYMKVNVLNNQHGLVQVNGFYYDAETKQDIKEFWSGWLPVDKLEVKEEL